MSKKISGTISNIIYKNNKINYFYIDSDLNNSQENIWTNKVIIGYINNVNKKSIEFIKKGAEVYQKI